MDVFRYDIVVVAIIAVGAGIYFFAGDDEPPPIPRWQTDCSEERLPYCRLNYGSFPRHTAEFEIEILVLPNRLIFGVRRKKSACMDKPWVLQVDRNPPNSIVTNNTHWAAVGDDLTKTIVAQMQEGDVLVVKVPSQPHCEREETFVDLENFAIEYEQIQEKLKTDPGRLISPFLGRPPPYYLDKYRPPIIRFPED